MERERRGFVLRVFIVIDSYGPRHTDLTDFNGCHGFFSTNLKAA